MTSLPCSLSFSIRCKFGDDFFKINTSQIVCPDKFNCRLFCYNLYKDNISKYIDNILEQNSFTGSYEQNKHINNYNSLVA